MNRLDDIIMSYENEDSETFLKHIYHFSFIYSLQMYNDRSVIPPFLQADMRMTLRQHSHFSQATKSDT